MEEVTAPVRNNGKKTENTTPVQEVKPRRQRIARSISQMGSATDMKDVNLVYKVDNVPTEWKNVPTFSKFSRSDDGSFPCVKTSKSSFVDLHRERQERDILAGSVYRLY